MFIFYNEKLDFRIIIKAADLGEAMSKLMDYVSTKSDKGYKIAIDDFKYECINEVIE